MSARLDRRWSTNGLLLITILLLFGAANTSAATKYQCTCTSESGCTIAKKKDKTESVENGTVHSVGQPISGEGWSCEKPEAKASKRDKKPKQRAAEAKPEKPNAAGKNQGDEQTKAAKKATRKAEKADAATASGATDPEAATGETKKAAKKKTPSKKLSMKKAKKSETAAAGLGAEGREAAAAQSGDEVVEQTAAVNATVSSREAKKKSKKTTLMRRKGDGGSATAQPRAKRKKQNRPSVVKQASNVVPSSEVYDSSRFGGGGGASASAYSRYSTSDSKAKVKRRASSSSSKKPSSKKDDDDDEDDSSSSSSDSGSSKKKSLDILFVRQLIKRGSIEEDDDGNLRFTAAAPAPKETGQGEGLDPVNSGEYKESSEYVAHESKDSSEGGSSAEQEYEGEEDPVSDVADAASEPFEFPDLEELPIPEMYPIDGEFEGPEFASRPGLVLQKQCSIDFWVAAGWEEPEWVMPEEGDDVPYVPVLLQADEDTFGFEVSISPYWDALAISTAETFEQVEYDFSDGAPYHVALVTDESGTDVFIDGELVGEDLALGYASAGDLLPVSVGPAPFMGWIGGIRIWNEPVPGNRLHIMSRDDDFMLQHRRDYASLTAYLKNDPEGELARNDSDLVLAVETSGARFGQGNLASGSAEAADETGEIENAVAEEYTHEEAEEPAEPFVPKNKW